MLSNTFHNTTAHYNAYFIAKERIKEVEKTIEDQFDWNYNDILPIHPQFDTTVARSLETQLEDCIKKSSLAIQRHPGSNWEDDSYILVGKARYYGLEFVDAIETFKYVNTKSEDDDAKHEALVFLMRVFIDYNEHNNAIAVSDYLKKEKLNRRNLKNLYINRGYLYQRRGDYSSMVSNLIQAEPLMTSLKERARISFIIGQVYQQLDFDAEAYKYYRLCLKNNPTYELSFYTKLNMAQVTELTKGNDVKKVRKYFKKLLTDAKNVDFRDKIYYEMANFEVKQGNLEKGIEYYNASVRASTTNKRQQAYSYLSLGKIYYDSLANYKLAKSYYDSTIAVLPQDEPEYEAIKERQEILDNFVTQLTVIETNDSLLNLSRLDTDSLDRFLDAYIAQKEQEELERKEKEKKRRKAAEAVAIRSNSSEEFTPIGSSGAGSVWYFHNSSASDKGRSEFLRVWGNRPLEDNWRRSGKRIQTAEVEERGTTGNEVKEVDVESEAAGSKIDKSALIASIPSTDEEKQKLLDEIEVAYYNLGKIYNFDLSEKHNAASTFETTLGRFPETEYKQEIMYLLYLIYNDLGNKVRSDKYKNDLIGKYPESIYAKIIINPNYRAESQAASEKLKKIYAQAYGLYKKGQYKRSLALINDGLREHPDNDFVDNMELLRILVIGKSDNIYKYQFELNNFAKTYSESELKPYVDSLILASETFQINLVNSTRAQFKSDLSGEHFFVYVYQTDAELSETLPEMFTEIIAGHSLPNLKVGNLILDGEQSMILISEFPNRESAQDFDQIIIDENPADELNKTSKFYNFVITKENFNIFYETKELDTYLRFYRKNY